MARGLPKVYSAGLRAVAWSSHSVRPDAAGSDLGIEQNGGSSRRNNNPWPGSYFVTKNHQRIGYQRASSYGNAPTSIPSSKRRGHLRDPNAMASFDFEDTNAPEPAQSSPSTALG